MIYLALPIFILFVGLMIPPAGGVVTVNRAPVGAGGGWESPPHRLADTVKFSRCDLLRWIIRGGLTISFWTNGNSWSWVTGRRSPEVAS